MQGRNPERAVTFGGGTLCHLPPGGSPFVSDRERGRRGGEYADHVEIVKMTQARRPPALRPERRLRGLRRARDEPASRPGLLLDPLLGQALRRLRHLRARARATASTSSRSRAAGGAVIEAEPAIIGVVNPNSPLVWDFLMVDAMWAWAEANQPIAMTPFLLAGATAPVSVAAGLSLQVAEVLSGVAIAQAVRPGVGCFFGSFFSGVDMRSGGPSLGMPESVLGSIAGGQLARRYGLPFRGGGGLTSANALDAQAATESAMSLWGTYLSGCDLVLHAAGWLEGGLTMSYEKLALDLEVLRMFERLRAGLEVDAEQLALETIREEGPGAIFFAAPHTLEHFREWVFMSPLFRSQAYPTWEKQGARRDARGRDRRVEAPARELRGSRHRRRRRRGDAGVHGRAQARARRMSGRDPRHDVLFEPVRIGPEDAAQPLLPGAALHRLRRREAVDAGAPPRASRPRAAGRRCARSTARSIPRATSTRSSRRASGTTATCARCGS